MKARRQKAQNRQHYTKAIDITFTIILIFITLVFGDYVLKSIDQPQKVSLKKVSDNSFSVDDRNNVNRPQHLEIVSVNHLRGGYKKLAQVAFKRGEKKPQVTVSQPVKSAVVAPVVNPAKPEQPAIVPVSAANAAPVYLYATYLTSNETGVVNLRKAAFYNAEVIKTIPTNTTVLVLSKGTVYYEISVDNVAGFVPKWTVAAQ